MAFETVAQEASSGHDEAKNYVITDEAGWLGVWEKITSNQFPQSPPPAIDFENNVLIGVFMGQRSSGGYGVEITKVVDQGGSVDVQYTEYSPGRTCIVTQALTAPYHVIKIAKTNAPVQFTANRTTVACE